MIFVYGVPGVGKTYWTRKLAKENSLKILELDRLRDGAQKKYSKKRNPFVYLGTTEAWQEFGDATTTNIIKGLKAIRQAMKPFILNVVNNIGNDYIVEGAFLDPTDFSSQDVFLIIQPNEEKHKKQFFEHRKKRKLC